VHQRPRPFSAGIERGGASTHVNHVHRIVGRMAT
jgi:hypothetical protein